ncbi:MAG: coenzyme F420-0:L-glutamate ligase / coenzyme F420:gamma-L-glutamate ligase [Gaiellaceae bacterium]|nr:coenzyme F420-0:L-glutamate ligase / coenzyme F420:gamma-L-glutamate ligase [Gaiellaceae bacterium]
MSVVEIDLPAARSQLAEAVLRELPEWFGIEAATQAYVDGVAELPTFSTPDGTGFLSLKRHLPRAAEIYVMGVLPGQHRRGIGRALVQAAEAWCRVNGIEYLQVKTVADSSPSEEYAGTRAFYEALGFVPLEVFPELWDSHNPALLLVKRVERGFSVFPLRGIPELREGDDLAAHIIERVDLEDGDVVVVAQKAISKIEGRVVRLDAVEPSDLAREIAGDEGDPQRVEWILREAKRVVRVRAPLVICETRHGFICASAGVDQSNTPERGTLVLLPLDSDASAVALRKELLERTGRDVGIVVTDSFGRPWRQGTTDVAIGAAGVEVMREHTGQHDPMGYELKATVIAVADELAGAAQLVSGKLDRVPVSIIRGLDIRGEGKATDIPIPPERDLFG